MFSSTDGKGPTPVDPSLSSTHPLRVLGNLASTVVPSSSGPRPQLALPAVRPPLTGPSYVYSSSLRGPASSLVVPTDPPSPVIRPPVVRSYHRVVGELFPRRQLRDRPTERSTTLWSSLPVPLRNPKPLDLQPPPHLATKVCVRWEDSSHRDCPPVLLYPSPVLHEELHCSGPGNGFTCDQDPGRDVPTTCTPLIPYRSNSPKGPLGPPQSVCLGLELEP